MTDAEATPTPAAEIPTPPPPQRPGRGLAALALLLALAAAVAAGYGVWRIEFANPSEAQLTREATRLQRAIDAARSAASDALSEQDAALSERLASQQRALDEVRAEVADALAARRHDEPPDARDWKLAEAEYLLRIANGRLLMERDVAAARQLLAAADALLAELDDFALHEVRAALAAELLALAQTPAANAQTLFLRLEAVKDGLAGLPTATPASYSASAPAAAANPPASEDGDAAPPPTAWAMLRNRFAGLFEYRTRERMAPRPLLRPDEALYLELNLRLALERAQLGALRSDATLYAKSLDSALGWLTEYVDMEDPRSQGIAAALKDAVGIDVNAALPDISGSLALLRKITRVATPEAATTEAPAAPQPTDAPRPNQ